MRESLAWVIRLMGLSGDNGDGDSDEVLRSGWPWFVTSLLGLCSLSHFPFLDPLLGSSGFLMQSACSEGVACRWWLFGFTVCPGSRLEASDRLSAGELFCEPSAAATCFSYQADCGISPSSSALFLRPWPDRRRLWVPLGRQVFQDEGMVLSELPLFLDSCLRMEKGARASDMAP